MHVTVTGVHVQGDKNTAAQHLLVNGFNALDDGPVDATIKILLSRACSSCFQEARTE